ncbi:DUF262 domain-containing protein [Microbispora bryophytorum]|uniref:DUF262 domain-containing protein n=1 Tax=Microbispora bryophytorum TaxID=1460882 RepID=UPI0033EC632D
MRLTRSDLELEVLFARIQRGEIDLQPDFQRGEVWDRPRQQRLIDTILRRWYVPAIHIVRDEAAESDNILDGQQRLRTIARFFTNDLKVAGRLEPLDQDLERLDGLYFYQLPSEYKRRFQRFEITVVTLTDYEPSEPSELFFRLNQQYALTPPEKRNALYGVARDQIKKLVSDLMVDGLLNRERIGFSNGRLGYDDVLARFCMALQARSIRQHLSNSAVEDFYRRERFDDPVLDQAMDAGNKLGSALAQIERIRLNKATLFSWLVFAHSCPDDPDVLSIFIREFEEARKGKPLDKELRRIQDYIRAYSDRSSYRVLDVSSVLLRDLVLHISYLTLVAPNRLKEPLLSLVNHPILDAEKELLKFIEVYGWGDLH